MRYWRAWRPTGMSRGESRRWGELALRRERSYTDLGTQHNPSYLQQRDPRDSDPSGDTRRPSTPPETPRRRPRGPNRRKSRCRLGRSNSRLARQLEACFSRTQAVTQSFIAKVCQRDNPRCLSRGANAGTFALPASVFEQSDWGHFLNLA